MRKLAKQSFVVVALGGVMGFGIAAVRAQDEAQGVIKYRQKVMKSHAAHFGAIGGIVQGHVPYKAHVAVHAAAINGTSKMIPQIFPEGSGTGETRAKPEIWQQWSKFEQAAKTLEEESAKLVEIAQSGDMKQLTSQFLAVGKACKGCHKPFRKRK
jgi:cytochrome c556